MNEHRTGRHRSAKSARRGAPIAIGLAVLCVVGGGTVWGLSLRSGDGDRPDSAAQTPATSSSEKATSPSVAATPSTSTPSTEPTASTRSTTSAASTRLTGCRATITTGQRLVAAAEKNYSDWSQHVYAQNDYDAGKITAKKAQGIWKRTKAAGPADLNLYDGAKAGWDKADHDACTGLESGQGVGADTVQACTTRAAAMSKLIGAAGPVYSGWKAHQKQMTHTEEKSDDPDAYFTEWFGRVRDAKTPLAKYEAAHRAYQRTSPCPGIQS